LSFDLLFTDIQIQRPLKIEAMCATKNAFLQLLSRGCKIIHFSGHGTDSHLFLEDGRGASHFLSIPDLNEIMYNEVSSRDSLPKLIVVAACSSSSIGNV